MLLTLHFECSNVQMFKCSNVLFNYSYSEIHYSKIQMFEFVNNRIPEQ